MTPLSPHRVLILDDSAPLLKAFGRLLTRVGAEVVLAGTLDDAKQAVREGCIDRVLSDVVLDPGLGTELYEWLLEEDPQLASRMVFMTGGCPDPIRQFLDTLPNIVLDKPPDPGAVIEALDLGPTSQRSASLGPR